MHLLHFNHLAVLTAAVAQFFLGWLWYGIVFQKAWIKLTGNCQGGDKSGMAKTLGLTFLSNLVFAFGMAHAVGWAHADSVASGTLIGLIFALLLVAPPLFAQDICEKRPLQLFTLNFFYWLLCAVISGGILAAWR
jgi:hypothetical protein